MTGKFSYLSLFAAIALASAAVFVPTDSEAANGNRVAIVDIQRVLIHSKAGKNARASFEKEFKSKQAILDEKARQHDGMEKEIAKKLSTMKKDVLKRRTMELERKKKELVRAKEDFSDDLRRKQEEMRRKIFLEIRKIVNKLGREEGYSLIITAGAGVLFAAEGVDVTEKVIDLYDTNNY